MSAPITVEQRLIDYFAEIQDCIASIQGALRHRQQPQDYHFHAALKACRDGTEALNRPRSDPLRAELIEMCAKIADAEGLSPNASASYCAAAFHIGMCIRALKSVPPEEK